MCCSLVCFGCMWFGWCVAGCSFVLVACGYVWVYFYALRCLWFPVGFCCRNFAFVVGFMHSCCLLGWLFLP